MPSLNFSYFFRRNLFELLLITYALSLAVGKTLWIPLLMMSLCGLQKIFTHIRQKKNWGKSERRMLVVALSVGLPSVISIINSHDLERTVEFLATFPLFVAVSYFAFYRTSRGLNLRLLAVGLGAIYLIWFAAVVWQFLDPASPLGQSDGGRYHGFFANHLGGDLKMPVIAVGFGFFIAGIAWHFNWKFLGAFVISSVVVLVILSGTRMVWLSLVWVSLLSVCLFFPVLKMSAWRFVLPSLVVASIAAGSAFSVIKDIPLMSRVEQSLVMFENPSYQSINHALSNRLPMWEVTLEMGTENPVFGTGANAWRYAYPSYVPDGASGHLVVVESDTGREFGGYLYPHQHVLEVFSATGFPGLIGLFILYSVLGVAIYSAVKQKNIIAVGIAGALFSYFFPLNTHHSFYSSWITAWFWLWFGILLGLLDHHPSAARISATDKSISDIGDTFG